MICSSSPTIVNRLVSKKNTSLMKKENLFDRWPEKYDRWFETPLGKLIKRYEKDVLFSLLQPAKGQQILDAGCGTGVFTIDILQAGAHVVGLELSLPMIRYAGRKATFDRIQGDMLYLPFKDNCFDKTVSVTAIDFIENAAAAVNELIRVTRRGGRIVVATLNSCSTWAERRRKEAETGRNPLFKNVFFRTPEALKALAPYPGILKSAIYFNEDEDINRAVLIEEQGRQRCLTTGAFLVICWRKP